MVVHHIPPPPREKISGLSSHFMWHLLFFLNRGQLKCDGTRAKTRFRLSAKRTIPSKPAGASVQSTAGCRGVRISGSNAGYTMIRGSVKGTGYPLHSPVSPSLPLPCVTVCHHISTGVYNTIFPFCEQKFFGNRNWGRPEWQGDLPEKWPRDATSTLTLNSSERNCYWYWKVTVLVLVLKSDRGTQPVNPDLAQSYNVHNFASKVHTFLCRGVWVTFQCTC